MRPILAFLILPVLLWTTTIATPNPADWGRLVYIGHNDSSYFCFFIQRTYPGIYYKYTDSVFICRFSILRPVLQEKYLLNTSIYIDSAASGHWDTLTTGFDFSVNMYLLRNHISFEFPSLRLDSFDFIFRQRNLILTRGEKDVILSSLSENFDRLRSVLDTSRWNGFDVPKGDPSFLDRTGKIVEYFQCSSITFFIVRVGAGTRDTNFFQYIVPVPSSLVRSAVETLER
jgi:hypothetical protein